MSNEWKDWIQDATDEDVLTAYERCLDNGWVRESVLYKSELLKRGYFDNETK